MPSTIVVSADQPRKDRAREDPLLRAGARKNIKHLGPEHSVVDTRDHPLLVANDDSHNNAAVEWQRNRLEHERQLHDAYQESLRPSNVGLLRKARVLSHNSNLHNPRQVNPYTADYYEYADSTITEENMRPNMFQVLRSVVPVEKREYESGNTPTAGGAAGLSTCATIGIVLVALLLLLSRRVHFSSRYCRCNNCDHQRSSVADSLAPNDCCESLSTPTAGVEAARHNICRPSFAARHNICLVDKLRRLYFSSLGSFSFKWGTRVCRL